MAEGKKERKRSEERWEGRKEGLHDPVTSLGNLENTFGAIYRHIILNISDNNCLKYISFMEKSADVQRVQTCLN